VLLEFAWSRQHALNHRVKRLVTTLLFSANLGLIAAQTPSTGWLHSPRGELVTTHYSKSQLGITGFVNAVAQDAKGRLFFGSDELLIFDGATWSRSTLAAAMTIRTLAWDDTGKLFAGAVNELGFFSEAPDGSFRFHSLRPLVPPEFRDFEDVWACVPLGKAVFFICKQSVLRWDGGKFTCWAYPSELRLVPATNDNETWFTHPPTGLYRLTADGPSLQHGSDALPSNAPFWLQRDGDDLIGISSAGVHKVGEPNLQLARSELAEFLKKYYITCAVRLADSNLLIGSFGGLALLSKDGRDLLRVFNTSDGLPTNGIHAIFVTDGGIWVATTNSGVFRFSADGAASMFAIRRGGTPIGIGRFTWQNHQLIAVSDDGIYGIAERDLRSSLRPYPKLADFYDEVCSYETGLLLGKFANLQSYKDDKVTDVLYLKGQLFNRIVSPRGQAEAFALSTYELTSLMPTTAGAFRAERIADLPELATELEIDPQSVFWINSPNRAMLYNLTRGETEWKAVPLAEEPTTLASHICNSDAGIFAVTGRNVYHVSRDSKKRLAPLPPNAIGRALVARRDGSALYAIFERGSSEADKNYALAFLKLGDAPAHQWTDLHIPDLAAAGVPNTIQIHDADNREVLWVSGSGGLLKIHPELLRTVAVPAPPWIQSFENTDAGAVTPSLELPYNDHRLVLKLGSKETDDRGRLLFATKLESKIKSDWSAPSSQSTFEFTSLSDGEYTFTARVVNAAGLSSAPVTYRFRVLPPWWRSNWAYLGYAAILGASVFGLVRVREHRIRRRNEELERIVQERTVELKKANAAKDEFLASVSHEIRNPLNGVVGLAAAINPEKLDPSTRKQFDYLRHCAIHLSGLLEDILDFSKLEAGAVTLVNAPFDLHEMVRSVTAITAAESAKAGIPVDTAISPSVPVWVVGDAARIRQIILNFVINALRYAGRGDVLLTVYSKQSRPEECVVTFAVTDDGPGIPPEELAQLFTRFRRGSAARKSRVGGSGLGLSVCKNLAEKMGGRLWAESEPGQGSSFFVSVPLPLATQTFNPTGPNNAPRWHALIVDDEAYNLLALASLLEPLGFQLTQAENGTSAIEAARTRKFDVVFLDFDLPDMTGPDISRALRGMTTLAPDMPVIATTAFVTADKHALCMAAGMNAVISKPITAEKIRSALAQSSAAWRSVSPLHPPNSVPADPLGALKLLASRKGVPFQSEVNLYFTEMDAEVVAAAEAIRRRDGRVASHATHKLTGRFAFIHARAEEQLARGIEAAAVNADWEAADSAWAMLEQQLPELRARVSAPDSAARGASAR
jgi:signal transduction histidine kinase/CheY-like chemotaxis protein